VTIGCNQDGRNPGASVVGARIMTTACQRRAGQRHFAPADRPATRTALITHPGEGVHPPRWRWRGATGAASALLRTNGARLRCRHACSPWRSILPRFTGADTIAVFRPQFVRAAAAGRLAGWTQARQCALLHRAAGVRPFLPVSRPGAPREAFDMGGMPSTTGGAGGAAPGTRFHRRRGHFRGPQFFRILARGNRQFGAPDWARPAV
jgi:hypothetical protein